MNEELNKLRKRIDKIDQQIILLLSQRLDTCFEVGKVKRKLQVENFLDKKRWQEVINSKKELGKIYNVDEKFIEKIYELIHQYTLKIEKENKR